MAGARALRRGAAALAVAALGVGACSSDGSGADGGDGGDGDSSSAPIVAIDRCDWPMWGHGPERTFAYPDECASPIDTSTVARLTEAWFFRTDDVVTATPAVVGDTALVGDWSGTFYALDLRDGSERWRYQAPEHSNVYSGQIVASAAVAEVDGEIAVFFASGKTMYARRATDGTPLWEHELRPGAPADDPTEIQSSPVVVDDLVIFGFDAHDRPGVRAGVVALDARTGEQRWHFDPEDGRPASGCVGVWSSPSVDRDLGLVFAGSANCPTSPEGWRDHSEAIFAVDLHTGERRWHFQPRGPNNLDFDFAGAPNLFTAGGRALVGLGGKDGVYYALERDTGELVWQVEASIPRVQARNFSTGGFIGPTAVADGIVVGGTAIDGPCPCLHAIDATTGTIAWQQEAAAPTFAATTIVNDLAFSGSTTDFTLRAVDLHAGTVLWSHEMPGGIAGGVAIAGDTVVAVAGIREPGIDPAGIRAGVTAFRLGELGAATTTAPPAPTLPPTTAAPPPDDAFLAGEDGARCVTSACDLSFTLREPPAGLSPSVRLRLRPDPYRLEVRAEGLGDPAAWIRPGGAAARQGAVAYGAFVSDDSLGGALLCVLDAGFDCVADMPPPDATSRYNRITILAIADTPVLPSPAEGFDRMVTTIALESTVELR
jgi:polyvinyl alcohol dehydrogenase (cytochrome)